MHLETDQQAEHSVSVALSPRPEAPLTQKSHKSAVCIIPPDALQGRIERIRRVHDRHFKRWMPHVNLLYPFVPNDEFPIAVPKLARVLASVRPFRVRLAMLEFFAHSVKSATVWMRPDTTPDGILKRIGEEVLVGTSVEDGFPEFDDLVRIGGAAGYVPHLSLGQWRGQEKAKRAIHELGPEFEKDPIEFEVREVAVISRAGYHDRFRVDYLVPLGGGEACAMTHDGSKLDVSDSKADAADANESCG